MSIKSRSVLNNKKRILVCGSVYWKNEKIIRNTFKSIRSDALIIHGGCPGVAKIADNCAKNNDLRVMVFNPDFDKYGAKAGDYRNKTLITQGRPDLVIAFVDECHPLQGELKIIKHAQDKNIDIIYVY